MSNVCMLVQDIYICYIYITYEECQPSRYENQPVETVDNFQRNAQDDHLVFQNEANISRTEALPPIEDILQIW